MVTVLPFAALPTHPSTVVVPSAFPVPQVIPSNFQTRGMHTIIRDRTTATPDFVFYADRLLRLVSPVCGTFCKPLAPVAPPLAVHLFACSRIVGGLMPQCLGHQFWPPVICPTDWWPPRAAAAHRPRPAVSSRQVVEAGLGYLPFTERTVVTPTGHQYVGVDFAKKLCGVSIIRSGESMENALRACCKGIKIGKILVHRWAQGGGWRHLCRQLPAGRPRLQPQQGPPRGGCLAPALQAGCTRQLSPAGCAFHGRHTLGAQMHATCHGYAMAARC